MLCINKKTFSTLNKKLNETKRNKKKKHAALKLSWKLEQDSWHIDLCFEMGPGATLVAYNPGHMEKGAEGLIVNIYIYSKEGDRNNRVGSEEEWGILLSQHSKLVHSLCFLLGTFHSFILINLLPLSLFPNRHIDTNQPVSQQTQTYQMILSHTFINKYTSMLEFFFFFYHKKCKIPQYLKVYEIKL